MSNSGFNCASDFLRRIFPPYVSFMTQVRQRQSRLFDAYDGMNFSGWSTMKGGKVGSFWVKIGVWGKYLGFFLNILTILQPGKNSPLEFSKKSDLQKLSCRCLPRCSSCRRSWSSATWSVAPWLGLHCLKVKYDEIGKPWGTVSSTTPRC